MKFTGRVDGLESLGARLAGIVDGAALADALSACAEEIRAAAQANPDHDAGHGELVASLEVAHAPNGLSITVGTSQAQGWHREFGTLTSPAAPWLEPAFEAARPGILARLRQRLAAAVR